MMCDILGDNESLHQISAILDLEEKAGDVLLLNDPTYFDSF